MKNFERVSIDLLGFNVCINLNESSGSYKRFGGQIIGKFVGFKLDFKSIPLGNPSVQTVSLMSNGAVVEISYKDIKVSKL